MSESRAERARALRYKRGALASMGFEFLRVELDDIRDACDTIHWWTDQDDETLLNALDGDDEDVWEFKLAFSHLEAKADELFETIYELCRYTALGNSIALPPWKWVLKRLCACYERNATMASLFGGIGGFPLIWERLNGPGSCLWTSEIGEFPAAVTKKRFCGKERW